MRLNEFEFGNNGYIAKHLIMMEKSEKREAGKILGAVSDLTQDEAKSWHGPGINT